MFFSHNFTPTFIRSKTIARFFHIKKYLAKYRNQSFQWLFTLFHVLFDRKKNFNTNTRSCELAADSITSTVYDGS